MNIRCFAWCDRVFMFFFVKELILRVSVGVFSVRLVMVSGLLFRGI